MSDCLFCKIVAREIPAQIVHEDALSVAFKDINPQAPTHVLVVPKKHIASLSDSNESDAELLGRLQLTLKKIASESKLSSFRVVANNGAGAGQSVAHLHYHLLSGRAMKWPPG